MDPSGGVTGSQGRIPRDHDEAVARLLEHPQARLRLGLERALQDGEAGEGQPALHLLPGQITELAGCRLGRQQLVCQRYDPGDEMDTRCTYEV